MVYGDTYAQGNHPDTAIAAALDEGVVGTALRDEDRCYALLVQAGDDGMTSDELSEVLGHGGRIIPPNQVASRILSLRRKELVLDTKQRRETRRGRMAIVWGVPNPGQPVRRPKGWKRAKSKR